MGSENRKYDCSKLSAEQFFAAYQSLPDTEKETFLSRLFNSLGSEAVAVTSNGKILSEMQYITHIESISIEVKEGNFISHEDVLKEMK